jgi:hypothetical protein
VWYTRKAVGAVDSVEVVKWNMLNFVN